MAAGRVARRARHAASIAAASRSGCAELTTWTDNGDGTFTVVPGDPATDAGEAGEPAAAPEPGGDDIGDHDAARAAET